MKHYIMCAGIILLLCLSFLMTSDIYSLYQEKAMLNSVAENMAKASALCLDAEVYSEGFIGFNEPEGIRAADTIFHDHYGRGFTYTYSDSNFHGNASYEITFYDYDGSGYTEKSVYAIESGGVTVSLQDSPFSWRGTTINVGNTRRAYLSYPGVQVVVHMPRPKMMLSFFQGVVPSIVGTAYYEYK